jgi:hypothetical protein
MNPMQLRNADAACTTVHHVPPDTSERIVGDHRYDPDCYPNLQQTSLVWFRCVGLI